MIESITRTVYSSTAKGRRYLTKAAAIKAEARALIEQKHPTERTELDDMGRVTFKGWHWTMIPRSDVLYRRVCRLVRSASKK